MFDAHCHLQDARISHCIDTLMAEASSVGIEYFAVNGTSPSDWDKVLQLHGRFSSVVPNFGVHPW